MYPKWDYKCSHGEKMYSEKMHGDKMCGEKNYDGKMCGEKTCTEKMYDDCDCSSMHYMPKDQMMDHDMCCDMPKMPCKVEKKCVKTYKCTYKLYKTCYYRLYKVCPRCGHEYDYHYHRGMCPRCD